MFASHIMAACRRTFPALLLAVLLTTTLGGPMARAAEPLAAVSKAVPVAGLLRTAKLMGRQSQTASVRLGLVLPLRDESGLQALIQRLYDRHDPQYGKFLKPEEFNQRFGPTVADYEAMAQFAASQGLTVSRHPGRTLVGLSGSSGAVEKAFNVRLNQYRMADGRVAYANDATPKLPASIAARVSQIVGLDNLIVVKPHIRKQFPSAIIDAIRPLATPTYPISGGIGTDPSGGLTPTDIKNVYNLNTTIYTGAGQSVDIIAPGGGYYNGDIGAYVSAYGLPTDAGALVNHAINGYDGSVGPNFEETILDLDMISGPGAPRLPHQRLHHSDVGGERRPGGPDGGGGRGSGAGRQLQLRPDGERDGTGRPVHHLPIPFQPAGADLRADGQPGPVPVRGGGR